MKSTAGIFQEYEKSIGSQNSTGNLGNLGKSTQFLWVLMMQVLMIKFGHSEKATKFETISHMI